MLVLIKTISQSKSNKNQQKIISKNAWFIVKIRQAAGKKWEKTFSIWNLALGAWCCAGSETRSCCSLGGASGMKSAASCKKTASCWSACELWRAAAASASNPRAAQACPGWAGLCVGNWTNKKLSKFEMYNKYMSEKYMS